MRCKEREYHGSECCFGGEWKLYLEANEDKRRIDFEGRGSNDGSSDVHQGVEEPTEVGRGPFEGDNESFTTQAFICEVKQRNDALTKADGGSPFTVYVERFGLARELKDDTLKVAAEVGRRDINAPGVGQRLQPVLREEGHQEVERIVLTVQCGALAASAGAAVAAFIWGQRRSREAGVDPARDGARGGGYNGD